MTICLNHHEPLQKSQKTLNILQKDHDNLSDSSCFVTQKSYKRLRKLENMTIYLIHHDLLPKALEKLLKYSISSVKYLIGPDSSLKKSQTAQRKL